MSKTVSSARSRHHYLCIAAIITIALGIALVEWRPFATSDQKSNVVVDGPGTSLAERWQAPIVDAAQWARFDDTLVLADSVGLTAVDLGAGEISWQLPGFTEFGWVSADGYVLARSPRVDDPPGGSFTQTYAWINPVGQVLWSATVQNYGRASAPPSLAGLNLNVPLASTAGFLVFPQYGPDGQYVGITGVAPDGSIAWTSASLDGDFYRRHPNLALGLASAGAVYELPTTLTLDTAQGDGAGIATYDVETGQSLRTFSAGTFYTSEAVPAAEVFMWRDWVVLQTAGSTEATCVLHGLDAVTGATWQSDVRCLEGNNIIGSGWLAGVSLDRSVTPNVQMIDLKTGNSHLDEWSGGGEAVFHVPRSELSWLAEDSSKVTAHDLEDGAAVWDVTIRSRGGVGISLQGDNVALWVSGGDAVTGDTVSNSVISVDADTGEVMGNYVLPSGAISLVLPVSSRSFLVLAPDYVSVHASE